MSIRSAFGELRRRFERHAPLITIRIDKNALLHNLHEYKKLYPHLQFAPVLKSNAYGHGLVLTARILDSEEIAFFALDSLYEARVLRRAGVRSRILVLGYVRPGAMLHSTLPQLDFSIVDIEQLRELAQNVVRPMRVHLKLDTGMHRFGITEQQLPEALKILENTPTLTVVGVFSHFADADGPTPENTLKQIASWKRMLAVVLAKFPDIKYRHIAASEGVPFSKEIGATVARLGIGLYGFDTAATPHISLKPVLEMRSIIASIRHVPKDDFVGYSATYVAPSDQIIATVPVGYFEGVDRALSNKGTFLLRNTPVPIVGRVSMNITSVDVTSIPNSVCGEEVVVISRNPKDPNSIEAMARDTNVMPRVLLVHIPPHLRRVVE